MDTLAKVMKSISDPARVFKKQGYMTENQTTIMKALVDNIPMNISASMHGITCAFTINCKPFLFRVGPGDVTLGGSLAHLSSNTNYMAHCFALLILSIFDSDIDFKTICIATKKTFMKTINDTIRNLYMTTSEKNHKMIALLEYNYFTISDNVDDIAPLVSSLVPLKQYELISDLSLKYIDRIKDVGTISFLSRIACDSSILINRCRDAVMFGRRLQVAYDIVQYDVVRCVISKSLAVQTQNSTKRKVELVLDRFVDKKTRDRFRTCQPLVMVSSSYPYAPPNTPRKNVTSPPPQCKRRNTEQKIKPLQQPSTLPQVKRLTKRIPKTNPTRSLAEKLIKIEQARQHESNKSENERSRVLELEKRKEHVRLGILIQRGE